MAAEDEPASQSSGQATNDDGVSQDDEILKTWDRVVIIKKNTVVKREISEPEFLRRPFSGEVVPPYWPKERLQYEAATLKFVASNITIPASTQKTDCFISRRSVS